MEGIVTGCNTSVMGEEEWVSHLDWFSLQKTPGKEYALAIHWAFQRTSQIPGETDKLKIFRSHIHCIIYV